MVLEGLRSSLYLIFYNLFFFFLFFFKKKPNSKAKNKEKKRRKKEKNKKRRKANENHSNNVSIGRQGFASLCHQYYPSLKGHFENHYQSNELGY